MLDQRWVNIGFETNANNNVISGTSAFSELLANRGSTITV